MDGSLTAKGHLVIAIDHLQQALAQASKAVKGAPNKPDSAPEVLPPRECKDCVAFFVCGASNVRQGDYQCMSVAIRCHQQKIDNHDPVR